MSKEILIVLISTVISVVYLQEIGHNANVGRDNLKDGVWHIKSYPQQFRRKPCAKSRRQNPNEQWIPSYVSRISHPINDGSYALKPQALKNEEITNENDTRIIDGTEDKSNNFNKDSKRLAGYDDCVDDQNELEEQTDINMIEQIALRIIKNCLSKTQVNNDFDNVASTRRFLINKENKPANNEEINKNSNGDTSQGDKSKVLESESDDDNDGRRDGTINNNLSDRKNSQHNKISDKQQRIGKPVNVRVCYACSSATNPTCWQPDQRTTVKYCSKDTSCITKTFGEKNTLTIIRDCADSCDASSIPGIGPKYTKCWECDTDLCNGAFSINSYNIILLVIIYVIKSTIC